MPTQKSALVSMYRAKERAGFYSHIARVSLTLEKPNWRLLIYGKVVTRVATANVRRSAEKEKRAIHPEVGSRLIDRESKTVVLCVRRSHERITKTQKFVHVLFDSNSIFVYIHICNLRVLQYRFFANMYFTQTEHHSNVRNQRKKK